MALDVPAGCGGVGFGIVAEAHVVGLGEVVEVAECVMLVDTVAREGEGGHRILQGKGLPSAEGNEVETTKLPHPHVEDGAVFAGSVTSEPVS